MLLAERQYLQYLYQTIEKATCGLRLYLPAKLRAGLWVIQDDLEEFARYRDVSVSLLSLLLQ